MVVSTLKSGETVTYTLRKNDKDDIMSNAISSKGTTEQSTKKTSETTTKQSSHITAPQVASPATKNQVLRRFHKRIKNPSRKLKKNRFVSCMETRRFFWTSESHIILMLAFLSTSKWSSLLWVFICIRCFTMFKDILYNNNVWSSAVFSLYISIGLVAPYALSVTMSAILAIALRYSIHSSSIYCKIIRLSNSGCSKCSSLREWPDF